MKKNISDSQTTHAPALSATEKNERRHDGWMGNQNMGRQTGICRKKKTHNRVKLLEKDRSPQKFH
eukprot:NODE_1503_length_955_cov_311.518764_g1044_i0.p7 GENE.NODE_1503_length_955_cov_311.518764_g1044_i0~~NODE_1503_length_955_cov_311.518764_g1044_i0.p7  ORF type:complete len:65 (+),score=0.33 NODE_1503_length_955_cov_311.518764_g1044_i0:629-823(+)